MKDFIKINKKFSIFFFFLTLIIFSVKAQTKDKFVVVIDAGHGGHDPGAKGPHANEKDVTLATALKLGKELEKFPDVKVIYTRTTDVFIELGQRAQIANDAKADLFISLHCNSAHSAAEGTETWVLGTEDSRQGSNFSVVKRENSVIYLEDNYEEKYGGFNPDSPEDIIAMTLMQSAHYENSIHFAELVEKEFIKINRKSRGVKQSGFAVLWKTAMPSVLIEMGFISNYSEGKFLAENEGQKSISQSVMNAFLTYKTQWDKKAKGTKIPNSKPKEKIKEVAKEDIVYKVQFLASKSLYKKDAIQFRGLKNVEVIKKGEFYKYYYGNTSLESEKNENLEQSKKLGFTSAYVTEFSTKDTIFGVEILTSTKKYSPKNKIFEKLENIQRERTTHGYSYTAFGSQNYNSAIKNLEIAQKAGFKDAVLILL